MWKLLLLVLSMLSLSMCTEIQSANNRGRLTLVTITPKLVEGKYFSGEHGIHFISKDGGVSITMMDKDGDREEPLFIVSRPAGPNSASVASILGHQFLLVNTSGDEFKEYGVPPSLSARARTAAKSRDPRRLQRLLPELNQNASAEEEDAFEQFLSHPDVQLIVDAAVAMGTEGITGRQYPAALSFYMTAMRLARQVPGIEVRVPQPPTAPVRSKRITWWWETTESCHHGHDCPVGDCPQRRSDNDCHGLCGKLCNCWWWVCFDCCYHSGCALHDSLCAAGTFVCWITAPIGLIC